MIRVAPADPSVGLGMAPAAAVLLTGGPFGRDTFTVTPDPVAAITARGSLANTPSNPTAGPVLVSADVDPPSAVVLRRQVSSADASTASLFPPHTIAPGGSTRWDITVRRASAGALPSSLVLRIASQHTHRKLADIAADVAETGQLPKLPNQRA